MKKFLSIFSALMLALPIAALAQGTPKIGTVDMQKAFKEYNKTKEAEAKINDAKNAAKKEYDDRAEAYKKALDEINNLNKQLESPALSADKKTGMAKERDDKIANIKNMEREISDFRQTRERQLQEQLMRMREGLVKEITDVVMEKVKAKSLDFVLDKSGVSINGVPVVLYAPDSVDFTSEIVETLNIPSALRRPPRKPQQDPRSPRQQRERPNPDVRIGFQRYTRGTRVYFFVQRKSYVGTAMVVGSCEFPGNVCSNKDSTNEVRDCDCARELHGCAGGQLAGNPQQAAGRGLRGVTLSACVLSLRLVWIDRSHR